MSKPEHQSATELADEIEALQERQEAQEQLIEDLRADKQELDQRVEAVQNGLSIPRPSRRSLLKAGGAGAAALLFGSATNGSAAAATGTIGSSSQRFDYFADTLDANVVDTDTATIGGDVSDFHWTEDANSPYTASAASEISLSINTARDIMLVKGTAANNTSNGVDIQAQVNGDTGTNYGYVTADGTNTAGEDAYKNIVSTRPDSDSTFMFNTKGVWTGRNTLSVLTGTDGNQTSLVETGRNTNATSPLSSIRLFAAGGESHDWTVEVFGRDVA